MNHPVHILATCRSAELYRATAMVFQTLRVGFPTSRVIVHVNGTMEMDGPIRAAFEFAKVDEVRDIPRTIHHQWILDLLANETDPFFILDTDVAFWRSFEGMDFGVEHKHSKAICGRFIPQFFDRFTNCVTRPRLHTSLMHLTPKHISNQVREYFNRFPETEFNPRPNLIFPCWHPLRGVGRVRGVHAHYDRIVQNCFYDTTSMLYHAIGGYQFTRSHLDCYDHLNFGTISDIVAPHYPKERWRESHFAIFENPELLKGAWRVQESWYNRNAVQLPP